MRNLVTFMSLVFEGAKLKYSTIDKKSFSIFKEVKHLQPFILKSCTRVIVPYPDVRNLLVHKEIGKKRVHWMTSLQEYDLEIKPTKIVKGQGICKMVTDSQDPKGEGWDNEEYMGEDEIFCVPPLKDSWYVYLYYF